MQCGMPPSTKPKKGVKQMKVTLVSGFLGSGKTSLLSHVLTNKESTMKCAVIVNEISEFNIDALAVEGAHLLQSDEKMVEMSNGCICCTLREDLLEQLTSLHSKGFDAALIESSGIAEPMQVAETFFFPHTAQSARPGSEQMVLQSIAPLDNCVTVVDAGNLLNHMESIDNTTLFDKNARGTEDDQNIATLMFDQLEFANVVLLNKIDMIEGSAAAAGKKKGEVTAETLTQLIKKINPHCEVIPTTKSQVPLTKIINTSNFTEDFATKTQGWMDDVKTGLKHVPETEEYGVSSFSFTPKIPFHPQRLWDWIRQYFALDECMMINDAIMAEREAAKPVLSEEEQKAKQEAWPKEVAARSARRKERYGNLFRGKGYAWIGQPKRWKIFASWGQAGNTLSFGSEGTWDEFPQNSSPEPIAVDPGQRLIFIGQDLNKVNLDADLRACLLTEEEAVQLSRAMMTKLKKGQMDMDRADIFPDPWGPFEVREEAPVEGAPAADQLAPNGEEADEEMEWEDEEEEEEYEEEEEDEEEEEEEEAAAVLAPVVPEKLAGKKRDRRQASGSTGVDAPAAKKARKQ